MPPITEILSAHERSPGKVRVTWTEYRGWYRSTYRGRITRVTKATVWVAVDGGREDAVPVRASRSGDINLRVLDPHEIAIEAWFHTKPETNLVTLYQGLGYSQYSENFSLTVAPLASNGNQYEYLQTVAAECLLIANWLEMKPTDA